MNTAIPATRTEGGLTHYAAGLGVLLADRKSVV